MKSHDDYAESLAERTARIHKEQIRKMALQIAPVFAVVMGIFAARLAGVI